MYYSEFLDTYYFKIVEYHDHAIWHSPISHRIDGKVDYFTFDLELPPHIYCNEDGEPLRKMFETIEEAKAYIDANQ